MNKEEQQGIIDSLYPLGKERWYKIEILDQKKCMKNLRWHGMDDHPNPTEDLGNSVNAIGIRPEYVPQLSTLMDIQDKVLGIVVGTRDDYLIERVVNVFKEEVESLKERVIQESKKENE